jgi:1-deoxy-D-xylulose-5-phosphate synthase
MIALNELRSPQDLKGLSVDELSALAGDLRRVLLQKLSAHGGHIGPNLGMVEATVALHYVFNSPVDKLVFDVSHQSYVHKMITGRLQAFTDPDRYDDVSGYSEPSESEHDHFVIGHTSTSVSLAGGMAVGRDLKGGHENIIAIIGDGSLSGGEALEGLDFAGTLHSNLIIVVNDNDMSIAENHGGLYDNLRLLRQTGGKAELNLFRAMGLDYRFVADGNDMAQLVEAFREVKDVDHPTVVHICTLKGKGFLPAETQKEAFHWGMPFDLTTGQPLQTFDGEAYDDLFATHMMELCQQHPEMAVITAGTPGVLAFTPDRRERMGRQFIDVGIAEQEAVALASGMAKRGARPCFGVVSSFIQRAYDQLSQDVAVNGTPVVLNIFYGSILGMNDVTHLGWFDIALIANIPGWVFLAPTTKEEYLAMLDWAMTQTEHPVVVRMPGGPVVSTGKPVEADFSDLNRYEVAERGSRVALIAAGTFFALGQAAVAALKQHGVEATLINPRFLSGVDSELLEALKADHEVVMTLEDGVLDGGFGEKIARFYGDSAMRVRCYGLEKRFLDRYDAKELLKECHLQADLLAEDAMAMLKA